jgi:hypothetical protein
VGSKDGLVNQGRLNALKYLYGTRIITYRYERDVACGSVWSTEVLCTEYYGGRGTQHFL